jgi:hypothetical protein
MQSNTCLSPVESVTRDSPSGATSP